MRLGPGAFRRMYETIEYGIRAKPVLWQQTVAGLASGFVRGFQRSRFAASNGLESRDFFFLKVAMAGTLDVYIVAQGIECMKREA